MPSSSSEHSASPGSAAPITAYSPAWLDSSEWPTWDVFVAQHPLGTIYQTSAWRRTLEDAFPHIRGRVLALRDPNSGAIVAGTAVYTVRSWLLGSRLVSIPFASRVDPLVTSSEQLRCLIGALRAERARTGSRVVELRLLTVAPFDTPDAYLDREYRHHGLDLTIGTEAIFKATSRTYVRQPVQKVARSGVTLREGTSEGDWSTFHRLYAESRRRLCLPTIPEALFRALRTHLQDCDRHLLLAERDGLVLGATLGLLHSGVYLLEWAGDSAEGRGIGANKLLYWGCIQHASAIGCHTFSFGRTSASNRGLIEYKRHWGTIETEMPIVIWTKSSSEPKQPGATSGNALRRFARAAIPRLPERVYGSFSRFCYRHLG